MERRYFTFGTDPQFDYGIQDYVLVIGKDLHDCIQAFKERHPNRPGSDALNCADYYSPQEWERGTKSYYRGKEPAEIIVSGNAYGCRPEGFAPLWLFIPAKGELLFMQEGSGDNLTPDDEKEGLVDYIDYQAFVLDHGEINESDGGMFMLPYMVQEHYKCLTDAVPDILDFAYGDMFLDVQILDMTKFKKTEENS